MNILLEESLMATKHIAHAGIIKRKDGTIKAKSTYFVLSPTDWSKIQSAFDNSKETRLADNALTFMDVSFKAVRADGQSVYGKNVSEIYLCLGKIRNDYRKDNSALYHWHLRSYSNFISIKLL